MSNSTSDAVMLSVREADEIRYIFSGMYKLMRFEDLKSNQRPVAITTLQRAMLYIFTASQGRRWAPLRSLSIAVSSPS